ncbi:tRNA pseudouridine(55) synthase TruB [Bacillaceae bacterium Marseille-Q3522]|nr:tRNA pseudouridine(55) synthase TruB [Bacillaceae bacterium Marseille-Q3522]
MEGILPLYKPKGVTSHDCVLKLRKIVKMKKIGHTGTLDPDVTGVLPICIGKATKVAEYITNAGKVYEGEVTIGIATATEDASGEVISQIPIKEQITREKILNVFAHLSGEIVQTPPMYSAVKVNGKRLYEYARLGIEVERPSRTVSIYQLDLLDNREIFSGEKIGFRFRAACSKGTYIRTLAVMIGEKLGYPAHMSDLIRVQSADFTISDCLTFADIEKEMENGTLQQQLFPLEQALSHLPKYQINDTLAKKVKNGAILVCPNELIHTQDPIIVITENNKALAIYQQHPAKHGLLKPEKVLRTDST